MDDYVKLLTGAVMVILTVGIGGYAFLALTPSVNLYLDKTAEVANSGSIFAGEGIQINATSVDWGVLEPDTNKSIGLRVTNRLDEPITIHLTTSNWVPENATDYMGLSWDSEEAVILGLAHLDVVLTLTVYSNVTDIFNFSFDITIGGEWF